MRGDFERRAGRLEELVAEAGLDGYLVTGLADVRYLTGFATTNGVCLLGGGQRLFFTDFRYTEAAGRAVSSWDLQDAERDLLPAAGRRMAGRVGFDDSALSVRDHRRLSEAVADGVELVPSGSLVGRVRRTKEPAEVEAIAAAAALCDRVYAEVAEAGLSGRTERDVAIRLELRMRELGAEGPSFPPIVAAGPNGALPHAEPGDREIGPGELVVVDMGCVVDGYSSDCTRTLATGEPGEEEREVYELVRAAQEAGLAAIAPGVSGRQADAAARAVIVEAGRGEEFGHGLGHGVGIEVHEAPRLAPTSEDELLAGDVVTVEPGVYVRGRFGVRIEDLVVVGEDGLRNLSGRPKELAVVG